MYTACTLALAQAMELRFLEPFPLYFVHVALLAWLATFTGLIRSLARRVATAWAHE